MSKNPRPQLLIIDDETDVRESTRLIVQKDFKVYEAVSGEVALQLINRETFDVVLCDIRMHGLSGLETLERIKKLSPHTEVIMQTAISDPKTTVKAMQLGAYDYLIKPAEPDQILNICKRAAEKKQLITTTQALSAQLDNYRVGKMLGKSKAMQDVFRQIKKIATTDITVLITGETGTGKELAAHALHTEGPRKDKPFIAINCGGIPAELLESELFGHERGSFTSADSAKPGKFELAQGGTIFLDEIGTMPIQMQTKLLRVLQDKTIERVGGTRQQTIDVRIIAATNEDLKENIKNKTFRNDLYHRLNIIPLELPALRERGADIAMLADFFLDMFAKKYNTPFTSIHPETYALLSHYAWPGNIRELEHVIQRIVALEDGVEITPNMLPLEINIPAANTPPSASSSLDELLNNYEKQIIMARLIQHKYSLGKTATSLNIHRTTLSTKMENLGISKD